MFFSNKANQTYVRLNSVLKRDKSLASNRAILDTIKADLLKSIQSYADVNQNSANAEISTSDKGLHFTFKVDVNRIKNFILND